LPKLADCEIEEKSETYKEPAENEHSNAAGEQTAAEFRKIRQRIFGGIQWVKVDRHGPSDLVSWLGAVSQPVWSCPPAWNL
jgi:hypothetical protein